MKTKEDIIYEVFLPKKDANFGEFKFDSEKINRFIRNSGIKLYSHQVEGFKLVKEGKNIVITTPTSSGKSLIYTLSILDKIAVNPYSSSILIFPLVALANDQYLKIKEFIDKSGIKATVSVYTGSTSVEDRRHIKNNIPNILITTPDMLNISILPFHRRWENLFNNLDIVVVDELHSYRGVLGSHVANVIRRLNRITHYYTYKTPQYILNSATIKNPKGFAEKFIQQEVVNVYDSGAPSPERVVRIYNRLSSMEIVSLIVSFLEKNIPTIVFLDSRKDIELFYIRLKEYLIREGKSRLIDYITPYRSGYSFEERRQIEKKLSKGEYKVVISTSALEMGVDIGSLEACILVGYPGTLSATWQRFGRAGRRNKKAYNVLIPKSNILDQYFLKNPEDLINGPMEEPVINPSNPYILKKHLIMMAYEKPIEISEIKSADEKYYIRELILEDKLLFKNNKIYPKGKHIFHIRASDGQFQIYDENDKKTIGTINSDVVIYEAHKNAVYIHNGISYVVREVDFQKQIVYVTKEKVDYFTDPLLETEVSVMKIFKSKNFKDINIYYGDINVRSTVIGYSVRDMETYQRLTDKFFKEDVLERNFQTKAVWFTVPEYWKEEIKKQILSEKLKELLLFLRGFNVGKDIFDNISQLISKPNILIQDILSFLETNKIHLGRFFQKGKKFTKFNEIEDFRNSLFKINQIFAGSLHAVEHSMIGIYSIVAMNDRWDIGGVSTELHEDTQSPTIFIYDGFQGGIGYSEVGFDRFKDLIDLTYKNISNCKCLNGCPSCILSPKCGNSNEFLDKTAAKILLKLIMNAIK